MLLHQFSASGRERKPISARVTNDKGFGVRALQVEITVQSFVFSDAVMASLCEQHKVNSLHSNSVRDVCTPRVSGEVAYTDADGVAAFREFSFVSAVPGQYDT